MDALRSLAEGDVFGFLTARDQAQSDSIQYAYDEEIKRIEERRDAQLAAIDAEIEKKQELMQLDQEAHQAQMDQFDKHTEHMKAKMQEEIEAKQQYIADMKTLVEELDRGELISFDSLMNIKDERLKEQAMSRQVEMLKLMYLEQQIEVAGNRLSQSVADANVKQFYDTIFGPGAANSIMGATGGGIPMQGNVSQTLIDTALGQMGGGPYDVTSDVRYQAAQEDAGTIGAFKESKTGETNTVVTEGTINQKVSSLS